jgi:hypothetical protein
MSKIDGLLNGDQTLGDGQSIVNKEVRGHVVLTSPTSFIKNCWVRGRAPGGTFREHLVASTATSRGAYVEQCTIAPQPAAQIYYMNGIGGTGHIELRRNDVFDCVDSVHASGAGFRVYSYGNWYHDMAFYIYDGSTLGGPGVSGGDHASDTRKPGWTHNDHFQFLSGTGPHEIIGDRMDGTMSRTAGNVATLDADPDFGTAAGDFWGMWGACVTVTPKASTVSGILRNCWLDGTEVQFQMPFQGGSNPASGNNWEISGNRCGMTHPYAAGKRFEHMRMTAGMGIISVLSPNVYGDFPSVTGLVGTPTTSPAPVPGNTLPSAAGTLPFTTRLA